MEEKQMPLNMIPLRFFINYFKNLLFSWTIFWAFFMLFLCSILFPWLVIESIDRFIIGFSPRVLDILYSLTIVKIIVPYLADYPNRLKIAASWFMFIILPLIVFITNKVFMKDYEKFEHKFVKRFFLIAAPITSMLLTLTVLNSTYKFQYPINDAIFLIIIYFVAIHLFGLFAYGFYRISELLENLKFKNGDWVYESDWKK